MTNNICIIPARGGSKRIPRKNLKKFLGIPILGYSIKAAIQSGIFDDVIVSTDDMEIAETAKSFGASVPFLRSNENSSDFATTLSVLKEVFEELGKLGRSYENLCCVYPTAPFITSKKIIDSFTFFEGNGFDSVLPVMPFSFPIQRSFEITDENKLKYQFDEFKNSRSQDLRESFHDAGQFYWMKNSVLGANSIITNNTGAFIISQLEGQDIDNEIDWKLAELKYGLLQSTE